MRWKALVPALVFTGLVAGLALFFADWAVEWAVEKAGTAANGAKVELDGVKISWAKLSIRLDRLQVTDKNDPMTNAVEVGTMTFALTAKPLAWSKVVVQQGEIAGIRTGTPRKSSGALPAAEALSGTVAAEAGGPGMGAKAKEAATAAIGNLKEQYDPDKLLTTDNLASYKRIQEEQTRLAGLADAWGARADAIKTEGKTDDIRAWIEKTRKTDFSGVEGLKRAKDAAEEGKKYQDELKALAKTVADAKTSLTSEIAGAKGALKEINALKAKDLDDAMAQIKSGASAEGLARGVLGPEWFGKLETWLGWFKRIRALMPEKTKKGAKPAPPTRKGKDIAFPFHHAWPSFHLVEASVSGETSGEPPLSYEGKLKDVSTDPALVARPIVLAVKGRKDQRALDFRAELDYRKETSREKVDFTYAGLELDGTKLGNAGGAVAIKSGTGAVSASLATRGESLSGEVAFVAAPVELSHDQDPAQAQQKLQQIIHDVLVKLNKLDAKVAVGGTLSRPGFGLKTSLDRAFADAVKKVLQKELDELKAKIRARLNALVDGEKAKLEGMVNAKSAGALDKFKSKEGALKSAEAEVDKFIEELKMKGTGAAAGALPGLPGGGAKKVKLPFGK